MDSIARDLDAGLKARLHEVAELLLEIYRTLVRMRYLDDEWIQLGPHNIDDLVPAYRSSGLDDSIIYLYSILPYVDYAASGHVGRSFFGGGGFAGLPAPGDGRDPLYTGEDLRPSMTPLTSSDSDGAHMVYSARTHTIWIYGQDGDGSADPALHGPPLDELRSFDDTTRTPWNEEDVSDDDWESGDGLYSWRKADGRPADDVLRDIARWYREFKEPLGGGGGEWAREVVEPLYRKHGWPGEDFNGNDFLVDQALEHAVSVAKYEAEAPIRDLQAALRPNQHKKRVEDCRAKLAATKTINEKHLACWELLQEEMVYARVTRAAKETQDEAERLCPHGVAQVTEDLPLWKAERLRASYAEKKDCLQNAQREANDETREEMKRRRHLDLAVAEREEATYKAAYEAARLDAERLCPGKTFGRATGREPLGQEFGPKRLLRDETARLANTRSDIEQYQAFVALLPDGADRAREAAEREIGYAEEEIQRCLQSIERWNLVVSEAKPHMDED